jgi:alpha-beta hydrolase superfamily lysophospholipase
MTKGSLLAALTCAPVLVAGAQSAPRQAGAASPMVRNVVLVHGAYADGSSYAKVIPLLRARGGSP